MYISLMSISYIAASFVALLGIGIVLLLLSKSENRSSNQYRTVMSFAIIVFAQCVLYSLFYYRDVVIGEVAVKVPLRAIDYLICGAVFLLWLRVIDALEEHKTSKIKGLSLLIGFFGAIPGMVATSFFMDNYYCFNNKNIGIVFTVIEILTTIFIVLAVSKYTFDFVRYTIRRSAKIYVTLVSIVLLFWSIQQIYVDASLYFGAFKSAWLNGVVDTTGIAMFISGLATFVYVFREDFSPLYYAKETEVELINPIDVTAKQHSLTVRELDVLRLVYKGMNNPEIADQLFISRNTVKKHLQNIFEKTATNSRMELIYLINGKEGDNVSHYPENK